MGDASTPQSVRFWTDDGFEVVLADDYDALVEQNEALKRSLDEEQARRYHYQAHGKPGVPAFSDCQAHECVDARASLASFPAKGRE